MGTRTHTYGRPVNTRRQFFGLVGLAIAGAALATLGAPEPGPALRAVYRRTAAGWERCRMYDLAVGDVMRLVFDLESDTGEVFVGRVTEAPRLQGRHWSCVAETLNPEEV